MKIDYGDGNHNDDSYNSLDNIHITYCLEIFFCLTLSHNKALVLRGIWPKKVDGKKVTVTSSGDNCNTVTQN